jgi:polyhydroxybutyrate depolymerase
MLAYALACNTGTFAAIGPDSATQLDKCAAPHPTSAMHIHGIADPRIRYEGDPGSGVATPDGGPSMPDLNAFWRNVDRCASPATTNGAITTSTANCPDGRDVVLITVDGGDTSGRRSPRRRCGSSSPPTSRLHARNRCYDYCAAVEKL